MAVSKSYKKVKEKLLADPKFRKEYEALATEPSIHHTTHDTDEAAYLCALGAKKPVLDRSQPRINFIFELTEEQMAAIPHHYDGTGQVGSLAISNARKSLLREIKNG
jgi:hypothetical protein